MNIDDFDSALIRYENVLKPHALRLTKDREEARDLLQETFMKAIANREKFRDKNPENLLSWLYTIMRNTFFTNCRKLKQRRKLLTSREELSGFGGSPELGRNQGEALLANREIDRAFAKVREDHTKPFLMHFRGYQYQEIAEILDLPLGTVKSHIHQARKSLQGNLRDYQDKRVSSAM